MFWNFTLVSFVGEASGYFDVMGPSFPSGFLSRAFEKPAAQPRFYVEFVQAYLGLEECISVYTWALQR